MVSESFKYSDEIIEKALPEIRKYFDDVTIDEIKRFGFLPHEIVSALEKQQAKHDLENEIYPISSVTDSSDGKTCDWCKSELVVKESTVSSSTGVTKRKVKTCPNGGMKCKIEFKRNEIRNLLEKTKQEIKEDDPIYVKETRHLQTNWVKRIFQHNLEKGFKVTAPNEQFTKLEFIPSVEFETSDKIVKKTGKIRESLICEHEIDDYIKRLETSKTFKLLKVEKIGNVFELSEHSKNNQCRKCANIGWNLERKIEDAELWSDYQNEKRFNIIFEEQKDVVHYRLTSQAIDSELPRIIVESLTDYRFNKKMEDMLLSEEIYYMVNRHKEMIFGVSKPKIVGQLKSLAEKNLIEKEVIAHDFTPSRYDKIIVSRATRPDEKDRFWKNNEYVGNATTLNKYRANDNQAVYLTKQTLKEFENFKELRRNKGWKTTLDGIQREWGFDEAMYQREIYRMIMQQFGYDENMSFIYNGNNGRIWIACKSGIKKKRYNP